jgi:crossover junction endodeoxyribonuclease RuvC
MTTDSALRAPVGATLGNAADGHPAGNGEVAISTPAGTPVHLKIVGVDVSLASTGLAAESGLATIHTEGHKLDGLTSRNVRLRQIRDDVLDWCRGADLVVIEGPIYGKLNAGSAHDRSGLWWQIVARLLWLDIPVAEVPPANRAKYATGKGTAPKELVLIETVRRFPRFDITNNNEADALVLMAMGYDATGYPLSVMPDKHRAALTAINWPEQVSAR